MHLSRCLLPLMGIFGLATVIAVAGHPSARAASSATTTVSVTVPSATSIDATACPTGLASVTSFGTVLPGTTASTGTDCPITFGSSNDIARLRISQTDGFGAPMWRSTTGTLDTAFGVAGQATSAGTDETVKALVVEPDAQIVVLAADATSNFVIRFNHGGGVDAGFGVAGMTRIAFDGSDIALDGAGRIVIGGHGGGSFQVARLRTDGSFDPAFDSDGVAASPSASYSTSGLSVGADDSITLAGRRCCYFAAAARFTASGAMDSSFDGDGIGLYDQAGVADDGLEDVHVRADGHTVYGIRGLVGGAWADGLLRLDPAGATVNTFGTNGARWETGDVGGYRSLHLFDDGRVEAPTCSGLRRFTAVGAPDPTFNGGVPATRSNISGYCQITRDADGNYVFVNRVFNEGISRLRANGAADTTFDGDGFLYIGANTNYPAIAAGTDGSITIAGKPDTFSPGPVTLRRYRGVTVPPYEIATSDWSVGASGAFGACLATSPSANVTEYWNLTAGCSLATPTAWNGVPALETDPGATIASSSVPGASGSVGLRFGVRFPSAQSPGFYQAPLQFTVTAP